MIIKKEIIAILFILLGCYSCKQNDSLLEKAIYGKWYGYRNAFGAPYTIAWESLQAAENNKMRYTENTNYIFTNDGLCKLEDNSGDPNSIVNDSAKFSITRDSTLVLGSYRAKIIKLTKDTLILYATGNVDMVRLFRRTPREVVKKSSNEVSIPFP